MLATNNFIPLTDSSLPFEVKHEDQQVTISIWRGGVLEAVPSNKNQSSWGFISGGASQLITKSGDFTIQAGMYFSANGEVALSGNGAGLLITQTGQNAFFHLGGPIEEKG